MITRLKLLIRALLASKRASVAVEFALIAPLMGLILIGTVQTGQLIMVQNRVTAVADSIADLVTRQKSLASADIAGIGQIANILMQPYPPSPLKFTALEVYPSPDVAHPKVCWTYQSNGGTEVIASGANYALPPNMLETSSTLIVVDVTYAYQPLTANILPLGTITLGDKYYAPTIICWGRIQRRQLWAHDAKRRGHLDIG